MPSVTIAHRAFVLLVRSVTSWPGATSTLLSLAMCVRLKPARGRETGHPLWLKGASAPPTRMGPDSRLFRRWGPVVTRGICTLALHVTAWSSLLGAELPGKGVGVCPGVWMVQEHKLPLGGALKKARLMLELSG